MRKFELIVLLLLFGALSPIYAQEYDATENLSVSSARMFMDLAHAANRGVMPTDSQWEELFRTDGYATAFADRRDRQKWERNIRQAFEVVFDESKSAALDSILSVPVEHRRGDYYFYYNFKNMKAHLGELHAFLSTLKIQELFAEADKMAKDFLPNRGSGLVPQFGKIYFVCWDPEGRAWTNGIYLDLYSSYLDGVKRTLAHELHHKYSRVLGDYTKRITDPSIYAIMRMQVEGTADLINKDKMPLETLGGYDQANVDMYNEDYNSSPQVLAKLDSLVCGYARGTIELKDFEQASDCAHYEGHTQGDYMTFMIREQLGLQAVIDCFGDFYQFVLTYNRAARKANGYVFSEEFVSHIERETAKMK